jgi:hypothetical protein
MTARSNSYSEPIGGPAIHWKREVINDELHITHNVWPLDWDKDGKEETLAAAYEGIFLFKKAADGKWDKQVLDAKGLGCEDLICADLNGDGKVDIIGVGRGTKNVKVYWNEGILR